MKSVSYSMIAAIWLIFTGCNKKEGESFTSQSGTVININGQTGCGFIILLNNGNRIEPVNSSEEKLHLIS